MKSYNECAFGVREGPFPAAASAIARWPLPTAMGRSRLASAGISAPTSRRRGPITPSAPPMTPPCGNAGCRAARRRRGGPDATSSVTPPGRPLQPPSTATSGFRCQQVVNGGLGVIGGRMLLVRRSSNSGASRRHESVVGRYRSSRFPQRRPKTATGTEAATAMGMRPVQSVGAQS